jgi:hypothetical protein
MCDDVSEGLGEVYRGLWFCGFMVYEGLQDRFFGVAIHLNSIGPKRPSNRCSKVGLSSDHLPYPYEALRISDNLPFSSSQNLQSSQDHVIQPTPLS